MKQKILFLLKKDLIHLGKFEKILRIIFQISIFFIIAIILYSLLLIDFAKHNHTKSNIAKAESIYKQIEENGRTPKDIDLVMFQIRENMYVKPLECDIHINVSGKYATVVIDNGKLDYVLVSKEKLKDNQIKQYKDYDEMKKSEIGCYPYE